MIDAQFLVVPDPESAFAAAAAHIARSLTAAVAARGRADWATTGGSAAPGIYRHLAGDPFRDEVPWADVQVWWGDDRFVAWSDEASNVRPFHEGMLALGVTLTADHLHPFRTTKAVAEDRDAAWAAGRVARDLADARLDLRDGWPVLDLVLVGIGGDGHVLSVFPGSAAFDSSAWALAIPAPTHIEPHLERMTLNPALLGIAREVLVIATGTGKAAVLAEIFGEAIDPRRWPAQLALIDTATWILDEAAAGQLPKELRAGE